MSQSVLGVQLVLNVLTNQNAPICPTGHDHPTGSKWILPLGMPPDCIKVLRTDNHWIWSGCRGAGAFSHGRYLNVKRQRE